MTVSFKSLGLAAMLAVGLAIPAYSQVTATPDLSSVTGACTAEGATIEICQAAVAAYVAALEAAGLSPAEIDAALGEVAVALGEASQGGAIPEVIAAGLSQVASAISDPVQAAEVTQLASAVAAGSETPVASIGSPTSASPN
ncbi:hypothetical protein [Pelagibacterium xiamenense]|uniref:hypothetical protein n=1 Tax=Pelagibacterium xiamenense TaxID=2901140 RepID=UPI001E42F7C6|nr:hypothetical protein [Pelagibacterium xiamenense]MCD7059656.1 hypothetical protein [Pelagibacterium xiamenense]